LAKSLQEQLKQAGLASQKQMVKARKAKNTKEKMQRKGVDVVDEAAELVKQRDAEKLERDKALNDEKNQLAKQKAIQAQIQQIVQLNTIEERGDSEYRFEQKGLIKTLMLNDEHRKAIVRGALAVVGQYDDLFIVPSAAAQKIAERDASWVIVMNQRDEQDSIDDDEYAGYDVPDDLMW